MNSYCSFCASAGIKGPHDHFLRASKEAGSKVVCPKLLATECKFCGKMGHTARFCGEKLDREYQRRAEFNAKKQKALAEGDWMDVGEAQREHPGFESPRVSRGKAVCPGAPKPAARRAERLVGGDRSAHSPKSLERYSHSVLRRKRSQKVTGRFSFRPDSSSLTACQSDALHPSRL